MTISDAFGGSPAVAVDPATPRVGVDGARAHARMRARGYGSPSVLVNIFGSWGRQTWQDLREAWWTPAALPTFQTAWAERMPDRDRVPGNNSLLYSGWVLYNHTIGLAAPTAVILLVGALTPLVWIARHPARLLLAAIITTALYFLTLG